MVSHFVKIPFPSLNVIVMMVEKLKYMSITPQKQRKYSAIIPQTMMKLEFFKLQNNFWEIKVTCKVQSMLWK